MKTTSTSKIKIAQQLTEILQAVVSLYEYEVIKYYNVSVETYNKNFHTRVEKYVKIRHMIVYLSTKFIDNVLADFFETKKVSGFNNNIIADCFDIERSSVFYIKKRCRQKEKCNLQFSDDVQIITYRVEGNILTLQKKAFNLIKKYYL